MKQDAQKRILVAGGAGFLGSHLCERLLDAKHFVFCVDNFYTGTKENIAPFLKRENFQLIEQDICLALDVEVEEIYNFACPASPFHYQKDPIQTVKTSVIGSLNLLELAKKHNAKIFQASTSEIYGDPHLHPQKEDYWGNVNPIGIRSCYDEGKRCAETLFFDSHRFFGTRIKLARIFNTYGPRMLPDDGRVVSNFIVQALQNKPLSLYGNGEQTRSFCFVDDLIEVILKFMESEDSVIGPINIGNPGEYKVIDLAKEILRLTGSASPILFTSLPLDDPKQRRPDISKAKKLLDWSPRISLEEGLKKTIQYFERALEETQKTDLFRTSL